MGNEMNEKQATPGLVQVFFSVMAGMFGVQSNRKHEKDFTFGKPSHYIIVGFMVTVIFVLTIWGAVSLVMKLATN
jgi:hypothetical protein